MFSIVMPMDLDRLEQFTKTKQTYDAMPQPKEFLIPTRHKTRLAHHLEKHDLIQDVRLFPYTVEQGFNCSKALNIAVRNAKYDHIIITSPEVLPLTDVLTQFEDCLGQNVLAQVIDEDEEGKWSPLVCKGFRDISPAMYFLALFNKQDIESINGWDESFMRGYAYEDDDFGARWNRARLPFVIRDDIQALHQYHPRGETIPGGTQTNYTLFTENNQKGITYCQNGLK